MIETIRTSRVPVAVAAKLLGLSVASVQCALACKALPIGGAWKNDNSTCYTYHISPQQLALYIGVTKEDIYQFCDDTNKEKEENI